MGVLLNAIMGYIQESRAVFPYKGVGGSRGNDRRLDGSIVRP
jgi:hypothetical protein